MEKFCSDGESRGVIPPPAQKHYHRRHNRNVTITTHHHMLKSLFTSVSMAILSVYEEKAHKPTTKPSSLSATIKSFNVVLDPSNPPGFLQTFSSLSSLCNTFVVTSNPNPWTSSIHITIARLLAKTPTSFRFENLIKGEKRTQGARSQQLCEEEEKAYCSALASIYLISKGI
ncbi:unnamed protein product [Ilex paraguariensis]|uniref:Uncharacterized protein n=1 Tax=Ilex paraguariensis TaxID=185542 RepID=A0ABC8TZI8_9AQUA